MPSFLFLYKSCDFIYNIKSKFCKEGRKKLEKTRYFSCYVRVFLLRSRFAGKSR